MDAPMRLILLIFMLTNLHGCATMYTVSADTEKLKREACSADCTVPRIYSGVAFDICGVTQDGAGQGGAIMFWDMLFSIPADTLILPYTVFMQVKEGGFSNSEICSNERPNNQSQSDAKNARLL